MKSSKDLRETVENICYHYKWPIIFSLIGLVLVVLLVRDLTSTPRYDVTVVMVSSRMQSPEGIQTLATYLSERAEDPVRFTLGIESLYVSEAVVAPSSEETQEGTDAADPVMPESMEVSQMVRLTAALSDKDMTLFLLDETSCRYLAELNQLTPTPTLIPDSPMHQLVELPVGEELAGILSPGDQRAEDPRWYLLIAPNRRLSDERLTEQYEWQMSIATALLEKKTPQ